jgi:hypothetical protein
MAGKKGQKKRFWPDEEKVSICAQTCAPGVSVAQVARRYRNFFDTAVQDQSKGLAAVLMNIRPGPAGPG